MRGKPDWKVLAALIALCAAGMGSSLAQTGGSAYPNKPVRIIITGGPGGSVDTISRAVGQRLSDVWKQPVIVDNQPGGSGAISTGMTAKAAPDGYTLNNMGASTLISMIVGSAEVKRSFDFKTAFTPVSQLVSQPYIFVIHPSVPANSIKEFITYAKQRPGQLNYASLGENTATHVGMELFGNMADIEMTHVPYKVTPQASTDLISGRVQALLGGALSAMPHVQAGKLKALGVTSSARSRIFTDLPTIAEAGVPGFSLDTWFGLIAPAGTPAAIISRVHRDVVQVLSAQDLKEKFAATGTEVAPSATPAEFGVMLSGEIDRWEKFAKTRKK